MSIPDLPMWTVRDYRSEDYEACLRVFSGNVPGYFGAQELSEFASFLARLLCPYLVVEFAGEIVACGGFHPRDGIAGLAWGMVARAHHGRGIGSFLLRERLRRVMADPAIHTVRIQTSQKTVAFYARFGFVQTERVIHDHYARGLHQLEMVLRVNTLKKAHRGDPGPPLSCDERPQQSPERCDEYPTQRGRQTHALRGMS